MYKILTIGDLYPTEANNYLSSNAEVGIEVFDPALINSQLAFETRINEAIRASRADALIFRRNVGGLFTNKVFEGIGKRFVLVSQDVDDDKIRFEARPNVELIGAISRGRGIAELTLRIALELIYPLQTNIEICRHGWLSDTEVEIGSFKLKGRWGFIGKSQDTLDLASMLCPMGISRFSFFSWKGLTEKEKKRISDTLSGNNVDFYDSFPQFASNCDYTSIHCDVTSPTLKIPDKRNQIIGPEELDHFGENQILINTYSGDVVDEHAIADRLQKNLQGFSYGTDCLDANALISRNPNDSSLWALHKSGKCRRKLIVLPKTPGGRSEEIDQICKSTIESLGAEFQLFTMTNRLTQQ